ncbi:MAG: hypothetical protein ABJA80_01085 [bacterium]
MRLIVLASALLVTAAARVHAQAIHEYRPELVVTLPRVAGVGVTLLIEQHLGMGDFAPNERILGVGVVSPPYHRVSVAMEARQVLTGGVMEHRFLPIVNSSAALPGGFEVRNRTRVELRDVVGAWSRRYQTRTALGHEVEALGRPLFPYVQLDFSYDSRFDQLNRREQTAGVRVPLWRGASVDPYVSRQSDTRRAQFLLFAAGAIMRVAL